MAGGKDGQTLFLRILPATTGGLTTSTAVELHLKVEDKECNVCLTKKYCITDSITINKKPAQFIHSFSRF